MATRTGLTDLPDDGEDAPRRKPARRRFSAFRIMSPTAFAMTTVFFFIPWTDLSCASTEANVKIQLATQSGYEAATGGYTVGKSLKDPTGRSKGLDDQIAAGMLKDKGDGQTKDLGKAHLLWLYAAVLVGGVVAGAVIPGARPRGAAVLGLAALALLVLAGQAALGFPLAAKADEMDQQRQKNFAAGGKNPGGGLVPVDVSQPVRSNFLYGFLLSGVGLIGAGGLGLIDLVGGILRARREQRAGFEAEPPPKPRRPREDDEDEPPTKSRRPRRADPDDD